MNDLVDVFYCHTDEETEIVKKRDLPSINDNNWYHFLSQLKPDEINFWQPGGKAGFKAIDPGAPFLFKLHSPYNYIVGGGFFVRHSFLPISLAWDAFGEKNGTPDYPTLRTAIQKYRSKEGRIELDPIIGCIILSDPFFFLEGDWIDVSSFWPKNLTQGKTFDTEAELGRNIWDRVSQRITRQNVNQNEPNLDLTAGAVKERYGDPYLTRPRLAESAHSGSWSPMPTNAAAPSPAKRPCRC